MYSTEQSPGTCTLTLSAVIAFAMTAISIQPVAAQPLSPLGDKGSAANPIEDVFGLTKTAEKYEDYLVISDRCSSLLKSELSDKDRKYLDSLLGWSENRLAGKELANANGLKSVGMLEQAAAELEKATRRYDQLTESHPRLWRAWMGRAVIHAQAGEYEDALKKFRKVLKIDVKNIKARFNCAEILYAQKEYDKAIVEYSKVLVDDATDVQALTGRGHCYAKLNQHFEAADDFLTVTKLQPDNLQAMNNLNVANKARGPLAEQQPAQTLTSSKKSDND